MPKSDRCFTFWNDDPMIKENKLGKLRWMSVQSSDWTTASYIIFCRYRLIKNGTEKYGVSDLFCFGYKSHL